MIAFTHWLGEAAGRAQVRRTHRWKPTSASGGRRAGSGAACGGEGPPGRAGRWRWSRARAGDGRRAWPPRRRRRPPRRSYRRPWRASVCEAGPARGPEGRRRTGKQGVRSVPRNLCHQLCPVMQARAPSMSFPFLVYSCLFLSLLEDVFRYYCLLPCIPTGCSLPLTFTSFNSCWPGLGSVL